MKGSVTPAPFTRAFRPTRRRRSPSDMSDPAYKKTVGEAFDEASAGYDGPALRFFDNAARELVRCIQLKGSEHVLDAASGTGKVAIEAARRLKIGRVSAIDLSERMLEVARKKTAQAGLSNVTFERADVDRAVFEPGTFDGLFSSFGVHFWPDMASSMDRLLKGVKPGGFVAITSFAKGAFEPQSGATLRRFTKYGIKLPATYTWEKLDHESKCAALLEGVGLGEVRHKRAQMGHRLNGFADWWDLVRYTGFRAFLNKMTPEQIESFRGENEEELRSLLQPDGSMALSVEVIFSIGKKLR